MNLAALLGLKIEAVKVILVGTPEVTNIVDSEDKPYYVAKLKSPIMVRCSTDPQIEAQEIDEIYLRESAITADGWTPIVEGKPEEGYTMPDWVADFSKGQGIAIYQATSIKTWTKTTRGDRRAEERNRINDSIRKRMADRKKD